MTSRRLRIHAGLARPSASKRGSMEPAIPGLERVADRVLDTLAKGLPATHRVMLTAPGSRLVARVSLWLRPHGAEESRDGSCRTASC